LFTPKHLRVHPSYYRGNESLAGKVVERGRPCDISGGDTLFSFPEEIAKEPVYVALGFKPNRQREILGVFGVGVQGVRIFHYE